ncbi:MAG: ATP-binding cassette domain-containing protein [Clostridium sp.]|nr:ATP-binding cassette domain-containing protein [Clostridium sp.]
METKNILKIENLTKTYKHTNVLNNISISLEEGKIYGLIGLNGAGKTTLLKAIAGFIKPSCGEISIFGESGETNLKKQRTKIGCFIESSGIYPNMTAQENIDLHRTLKGIPNEEITDELIERVNLKDIKDKKVKEYSLGMKQRLGIAIALIGNPEFLILDEPINGLDPVAIIEVRNMLKKLSEEKNITVFISSHILSELYSLASDYIIIHKGEIKEQITSEELDEKCRKHILLKSNEPEKMAYVIENNLKSRNYVVMPDKSIQLYDYMDNTEKVAKTFMDERVLLTNLSCEGDSLEDYFVNAVGGKNV